MRAAMRVGKKYNQRIFSRSKILMYGNLLNHWSGKKTFYNAGSIIDVEWGTTWMAHNFVLFSHMSMPIPPWLSILPSKLKSRVTFSVQCRATSICLNGKMKKIHFLVPSKYGKGVFLTKYRSSRPDKLDHCEGDSEPKCLINVRFD